MVKPYEQRFPWQLDWNLLRTFMVVVEQRGISRAADFLGLKQPTISSALKRLEQTTGQVLIIRKPNEFKVTRAGQVLYSECSSIFGAVSQLPSLLQTNEEELRGHIFVA
ncbi:MAG: LysR family transcriptional regulator, partial [Rhodobacteraceae bacterium]|nr:LysR family transcriptional regulator [Paracoccaceae bacterium]